MGDQRDQVAHLALYLGHRGHQSGRTARFRDADVEAHVGAAVALELHGRVHMLGQALEPLEVARRRPLRGQHGGAGLNGDAEVEHGPCAIAEDSCRHVLAERRLFGHERPARAAAHRHQMAALHERRDRLAQRRARDAQAVGQVALRGQPAGGLEQAEADCGAEPLDRLLEGGRRLYRLEDGLQRRCTVRSGRQFHGSKGTPAAMA